MPSKDGTGTLQKTRAVAGPQSAKILMALLDERMQQPGTMELKLARPSGIPGYSMAARLVDRCCSLPHIAAESLLAGR
jgi:hypothetical protein